MRDGGTPQRVYRLVPSNANTPPRTVMTSQPRTAIPLSFCQSQTPDFVDSLPVSPESVPRVVSYRIHPVRSEADFGRTGAVFSSELQAPVSQYQGGPSTCPLGAGGSGGGGVGWSSGGEDNQYDSRLLVCFPALLSVTDGNSFSVHPCVYICLRKHEV